MKRLFYGTNIWLATFLFLGSSQGMAAVTTEELGKMLLGGNYETVTQHYNVYYSGGKTSSSTYGGCHTGIDYRARTPLTVYSPVKGTVVSAGGSYGTASVKVDGTNYYFMFTHLSSFSVKNGTKVGVGTIIGKTGSVGAPGQPHLHVEARNGRSGGAYYFKADRNNRCTLGTGYNVNPTSIISFSSSSSNSTSTSGTSTSSSGYRKTPVNLTIHGVTSINEDSSTSYTTKVRYSDGTSKNVSSSWTEYSSYTKFSGSRLYTTSVSSDQKVYIKASYTENGVKVEAGINVTIKNKTYSYNSSSSSSSSSGSSSSSSSTSASSVIYSFYYKNRNYFGSRKGSTYTYGSYTYQNFNNGKKIKVKKSGSYYYIYWYDGRTWQGPRYQRV